jgi:hypothetical protein
MIEPKKAVKWKESAEDDIPAPVVVQDDGTPKPSPTMAFLGLCYNTRALTSMLISFSVGIYMGGILDGALTLKLKDVSLVCIFIRSEADPLHLQALWSKFSRSWLGLHRQWSTCSYMLSNCRMDHGQIWTKIHRTCCFDWFLYRAAIPLHR